jgi:hypothetical protein
MTKPMETAAYFQAHKDDDTEWGEPVSSGGGTSRRLASMISIRLAPEEADRVRAAANERGETLSQFVREAALNEASASLGRAWIEFNTREHHDGWLCGKQQFSSVRVAPVPLLK